MKLRQMLAGLKTYLPGAETPPGTGGTDSARYCYSVWLRHLVIAHAHGFGIGGKTIAELGPGDSLGTGLAGLLSGADRYYALDVVAHADARRNVEVFEALISLFTDREDVPGEDELPNVYPRLRSYRFPAEALARDALGVDRVQQLRSLLTEAARMHAADAPLRYLCPWRDAAVLEPESVDLVFSQAVLEYVPDLPAVYRAASRWLRPGGWMSHLIDFSSHGTAAAWNGHWAYSRMEWRLLTGRRPVFLNREPLSSHLGALRQTGFDLVAALTTPGVDGLPRRRLAAHYRGMSELDLSTRNAHLLLRRAY